MTLNQFLQRYQFNTKTNRIGGGGFGDVYKAFDNDIDSYVAIKVAQRKANHPELTLHKEIEVAKNLPKHKNIAKYQECHTFEPGGFGEVDYAIMTFYPKGSLADLMANEQLSHSQIEFIIEGIIDGLECLHNNQIIHRDLKPQNILIQEREGNYIPKITDFGISKIVEDFENSKYSNSSIFGTTAYSSPEQLSHKQKIGYNTDIWSLGIIVWQLFLGETPFKSMANEDNSANAAKLIHNICNEPLSKEIANIPQPYQNLVKQCLLKNNDKRLSTVENARQLINTIEPLKAEPKPISIIDKEAKKEIPIVKGTDILDKSKEKVKQHKPKAKKWLYALPLLLLLPLAYLAITQLTKPKFEDVREYHEGLAAAKKDGKWGFIDRNKKTVINFSFDEAADFSNGSSHGFIEDNPFVINKMGEIVSMPSLTHLESFKEGFSVAISGQTCIYFDNDFKILKTFQDAQSCYDFHQNLAIVNYHDYCKVLHVSGKFENFPCDNMLSFREDIAPCQKNGKWGFVHKSGSVIYPNELVYLTEFSEGKAVVSNDGVNHYFINKKGDRIFNSDYKNAWFFTENRAAVLVNNKWGFINADGKLVVKNAYDEVLQFSEGKAACSINDKWGFIDLQGRLLIDFKFEEVRNFSEGLAAVKTKDGWGYLDSNGKLKIYAQFDQGFDFKEGIARVRLNSVFGYIDKSGSKLILPQFEKAKDFSEGFAAIQKNGFWDYIDKNGQYIYQIIED